MATDDDTQIWISLKGGYSAIGKDFLELPQDIDIYYAVLLSFCTPVNIVDSLHASHGACTYAAWMDLFSWIQFQYSPQVFAHLLYQGMKHVSQDQHYLAFLENKNIHCLHPNTYNKKTSQHKLFCCG